MKFSQLFGKPTKDTIKSEFISHEYLVKGGFIRESVAGRYFFLPLGMRVRNKVIVIIREEMNTAGAQEMLSPTLHPIELWQETNRDNAGNFGLMNVTDRRGGVFALGGTAEEMFADVVRKFQISYKDLPFNVYQFSTKFRDELRARGGLLRTREFTMKDAYSFDVNEEAFRNTYQTMADTYTRIFDRVGLTTKMVAADNGYIGGEYCHEFIAESGDGESRYLESEDGQYIAHEDVATFALLDMNPEEEILPLEEIEQPAWVRTMEDNKKHYGEPSWRYLKNVVYKNISSGEIVIVTIRGDLDVNKTKLEKVLGAVELLEEATSEDLARIGTKPGYVHAWGHNATYIADNSLKTVRNFIGGQKEETTDTIHVNYGRDFRHDIEADVALAQEGYITAEGEHVLIEKKGIEVGNIFQLGTHYSQKMADVVYTDENGTKQLLYMGCYGIGVERTLATVVEMHHDDRGIIWPKAIAPYHIHIVSLHTSDDEVFKTAGELYSSLVQHGVDVLFDDRTDVSAGEKFADADLIGIPYRVTISKKTLEQGNYEVKDRASGEVSFATSFEELVGFVND